MESLPVEILQPIFFLSNYNIALLQASPRIATRLSSEYVYKATCGHYLTGVLEDRVAQTVAQTFMFASRWMTWSFFKTWHSDFYGPIGCLCGSTCLQGCFDPQWPPDFEQATNMVFSRSHLPRLAFVKARIPKKLLCGPWFPDKVQYLAFLLWITSMTVDWNDAETRQVAVDGRLQAIREGSLEAVELFNHNRRLGRNADLTHVGYAVFEGGCNRSIVYDTMHTASTWNPTASWECPELDNWCEGRITLGDPKGQWLKIKLEELRATSHPGKVHQGPELGYKRLPGGELHSETGNYDGGTDDQLIVKQLKWNQVSNTFTLSPFCRTSSSPFFMSYRSFRDVHAHVRGPFNQGLNAWQICCECAIESLVTM